MRPGAFARLDEEIWQYYTQNKQSDESLQNKQKVLDELRSIAQQALAGLCNVNLVMCGSSANGCGTSSSDLNLCLQVAKKSSAESSDDDDDLENLDMILEKLEKIEGQRHERVYLGATLLRDRIPMIRLRTHTFSIDISCDNEKVAHRTAKLISNYSLLDMRFPALAVYVNKWASDAGIKGQRCLSSYALTLMVIVFLQCGVETPVLPNLQLFSSRNRLRDAGKVEENLSQKAHKNEQTIGELLIAFFKFYAIFDFCTHGISVSKAGKCERPADLKIQFFIEEPCSPQRAVVCIQEANDLIRVQDAFRKEADRFEEQFDELPHLELQAVPSLPPTTEEASPAQPIAFVEQDLAEAQPPPEIAPVIENTPTPAEEPPQEQVAVCLAEDSHSKDISPAIERNPTPPPDQLPLIPPSATISEDIKDARSEDVSERIPTPGPSKLPEAQPVSPKKRPPTAIIKPQQQTAKKAVASVQQPKPPVNPEPKPSLVSVIHPLKKQKAEVKEKPVQQPKKAPAKQKEKPTIPPPAPAGKSSKKTDRKAAAAALRKNPSKKSWFRIVLGFGASVLILILAVNIALEYMPMSDEQWEPKKSSATSLPEEFYGRFVLQRGFTVQELDAISSKFKDFFPEEIEIARSSKHREGFSLIRFSPILNDEFRDRKLDRDYFTKKDADGTQFRMSYRFNDGTFYEHLAMADSKKYIAIYAYRFEGEYMVVTIKVALGDRVLEQYYQRI